MTVRPVGDFPSILKGAYSGATFPQVLQDMWDTLQAQGGVHTVRTAAGVPTGAPNTAIGELPIAFDTTAVSGGLYSWNGSAWVKAATIP